MNPKLKRLFKPEGYKIVITIALIIFMWLTYQLVRQTWWGPEINFELGSYYGALLAGLFSFLSVILIAITLKNQSDTARFTQFEDRFFLLLQIQRENSENIQINEFTGRKVFILLLDEFKVSLEICRRIYDKRKIKLKDDDLIDIAYKAFFYGANNDGLKDTFTGILKTYNSSDDEIESFFSEVKIKSSEENSYKYFNGHQIRLGHYYRHFFQSIKYIDNYSSPFLDSDERKEYVKLFRAQISTHEQILFFFSSVSTLGRAWELDEKSDRKLITEYNLLTNIVDPDVFGIKISDFYPHIKFEGQPEKYEEKDR